MKLIIDVDEKLVCEGFERSFTEEERNTLIRSIGNATPYNPSGDCVSRKVIKGLISDKSIPIKFEEEKRGEWQNSLGMPLGDIYTAIDNAPTVEQPEIWESGFADGLAAGAKWAERQKGEWIEEHGLVACSNCHTIWLYRTTDFCPHCGADMRGGSE